MIILVPLLFAIGGALVYAFSANPKVAALGLATYGAGMTAMLIVTAGHSVKFLT